MAAPFSMAAAAPSKKTAYPNVASEYEKCVSFLSSFSDIGSGGGKKYLQRLQAIANRESTQLDIELDDIKMVSTER